MVLIANHFWKVQPGSWSQRSFLLKAWLVLVWLQYNTTIFYSSLLKRSIWNYKLF